MLFDLFQKIYIGKSLSMSNSLQKLLEVDVFIVFNSFLGNIIPMANNINTYYVFCDFFIQFTLLLLNLDYLLNNFDDMRLIG